MVSVLWRQESHRSPLCELCSFPLICPSVRHCSTPTWVAPSQVRPNFLWRPGVQDMAYQLVADIRCEAVHYPACRLFPSWWVPVCRIRRCVISSVDITPVDMHGHALVHLVRPRCVVASFELLRRKQASHSSVHFLPFVLYLRLGFVCLLSAVEVLNPHDLIPCKSERAEAQQPTQPDNNIKENKGLMNSLRKHIVRERDRESRTHKSIFKK